MIIKYRERQIVTIQEWEGKAERDLVEAEVARLKQDLRDTFMIPRKSFGLRK